MSPVLAFGDDHSEGANRCWDWIAAHRWDGWSIDVVTARPPAGMQPVPPELSDLHGWTPDDPRDGEAAGFSSVTHLTAEADPRVALIARDWDLVAVGARGTGLLKRLHLGSVVDWLLREPTSPLVIARSPGPVRSVLVADDGSKHAQAAIETLLSLPWLKGATVRVLVVDDGHVEAAAVAEPATMPYQERGVEVDVVVRSGDPKELIVAEIDDSAPDLVVMGARGHGGVRRIILGSSASAVANATDRTLLVAHAEPGPTT